MPAPNPDRYKIQSWSRFDESVAKALRGIRADRGLRQKDMGELCGLSQMTYGGIELGLRRLRLEEAVLLMEALDLSIQDLTTAPCEHIWTDCTCEREGCRRELCVLCETIQIKPREQVTT